MEVLYGGLPMSVFTALVGWLIGTMVPLALAAGCLWAIFAKVVPRIGELSMHQTSGEEIYFGLLYAAAALGLAFVAIILAAYALVRNWRMWK
jgi:hypothetical protein